jgi:hypothetical protein
MANENGWGDGSSNNAIGWGQGANNATGWGSSQATSWSGLTNVVGTSSSDRDADAQAFITAAAITDATQQSAIDTLVTGLKTDGIWTKMKAIYPFVGGTATSHKYNLKDPRDLNAAFRLTFSGGWTHSINGATPNGINTFADTFYNPSVSGVLNSSHLSYYSRTNANGTEVEIGVEQAVSNYQLLEIRTANLTYFLINQISLPSVADTNSLGYYIGNRQASNDSDGWKNGVKILNGTAVSNALANQNIYLGALNKVGVSLYFSTKQCAFSSIGDGLTDTDATNLYTRVQAFQTSLSRQV